MTLSNWNYKEAFCVLLPQYTMVIKMMSYIVYLMSLIVQIVYILLPDRK